MEEHARHPGWPAVLAGVSAGGGFAGDGTLSTGGRAGGGAARRPDTEGRAVMSQADDCVLVADAIRRLHAAAGLPWPPPTNGALAPVPLDTLIATHDLA